MVDSLPKPFAMLRRRPVLSSMLAASAMGVAYLKTAEDSAAAAVLGSVPRTLRALWWAADAAWQYHGLRSSTAQHDSQEYHDALAEVNAGCAAKLLSVCQANGGVYIKAGQFSTSIQAVPVEYRRVLETLQDQVPPRPFEVVKRALELEFSRPLMDVFTLFEDQATAAASLAQVHRATLPDGREVAVKVQYPGLESEVLADLAAMRSLSTLAQFVFPTYDLDWLFVELEKNMRRELDFRQEVQHAAKLQSLSARYSGLVVPHTVPELCSRHVITMEWIDGCKITDLECLERCRLRRREVALLLTDSMAFMTYEAGYVHGDPHPGNIIVRTHHQGRGLLGGWLHGQWQRPQIVFLDHGLYIEMPDLLRQQYCQMWCAFVINNQRTATQIAIAMAGERAGRILPDVLRPRNWSKVPKEERKKMREGAGVNSLADVGRLLDECPKPLVDVLRVLAVVRHTATLLGATVHDRLRINATHAINGMAICRDECGSQVFIGDLQSRTKRLRLSLSIWAMRSLFWLKSIIETVLTRWAEAR